MWFCVLGFGTESFAEFQTVPGSVTSAVRPIQRCLHEVCNKNTGWWWSRCLRIRYSLFSLLPQKNEEDSCLRCDTPSNEDGSRYSGRESQKYHLCLFVCREPCKTIYKIKSLFKNVQDVTAEGGATCWTDGGHLVWYNCFRRNLYCFILHHVDFTLRSKKVLQKQTKYEILYVLVCRTS